MTAEVQKMKQEFLQIAQNFLEKGKSPRLISEVMAESITYFVQKNAEHREKLIIEAIYAHFAKILERDSSAFLPGHEESKNKGV